MAGTEVGAGSRQMSKVVKGWGFGRAEVKYVAGRVWEGFGGV